MDLGFILGAASFALLWLAGVALWWQQRDVPSSKDDPNQMQPGDEVEDENPN